METESRQKGQCISGNLEETQEVDTRKDNRFRIVLTDSGLEKYFQLFEQNNLTGSEILYSVTENDMEKIGISNMGDRKKISNIINTLKPQKEQQSIPMFSKKQKIRILIGLEILVDIILALCFHVYFGDSGFEIFPKDHLTLSDTIITDSDIEKLIRSYNNANIFERNTMNSALLFKKLMEKGLIRYRQ
ncbi:MAG: SAM domain-containing protein [Spirochaetales bacterium]|jgi:hypothetical protein|nr:SAM domain-containing protein [Spirochaetales bacterium]